ncbi:hypothetical protein QGM71_05595 [Virgibacillus sp. C22-A2]|uniref:Uncharacterized protein n=1 Tax=Virgibacillus tibetensis TaxID=3042313 RepID=A0ABU6KCV5_9BACI|nr:hypothetical protein [Virgibacillus sp. C22-A2]
MPTKSIGHKQLISKCLSVLPTEAISSPLLNYEYDKLSVDALMKIFVAAQLDKWESYEDICINDIKRLYMNYLGRKARLPKDNRKSQYRRKRRQCSKEMKCSHYQATEEEVALIFLII